MLNSKNFAKRLEKILDFYGLTASALAEEIDFNRSTISHLISGRNKPSLEFVMKLLQKFPELDMDWLAFGKGNFPPNTKKEEKIPSHPAPTYTKSKDPLLEVLPQTKSSQKIGSTDKKIDRIVLFFEDGTFKVYEN